MPSPFLELVWSIPVPLLILEFGPLISEIPIKKAKVLCADGRCRLPRADASYLEEGRGVGDR